VRPEFNSFDTTAEALPEAVQDRLARILDDYLVAVELGAPITPEELLARHPDDAQHLRGYLSGLQLFHAAANGPKAPRPISLAGGKLQPAQVIGDFQLVREIGRGGMGVVYEAEQLSLRRRVALKILPFSATHDPKQIGRFKNEAQAAAHVQHPNIVPVYAVGEENGVHYYAMQLIDGESLSSQRPQKLGTGADDTLPELCSRDLAERSVSANRGSTFGSGETGDRVRHIAGLGIQAAEALHAAHEYGIVHRDVKPSNLLVDAQGKLWVTDFGLARCRETSDLTQTGDILGTMRYMSPEQALGRTALVDHRTDVYSLGVTLYELATDRHPSGAKSDAEIVLDCGRFTAKPPRHWNRRIPVDFQTIVLKAIAEFPNERYTTAQALADDLQGFLDGKPILASPPSVVSRVGKWAGRHRGVVAATAAVLLVACAGLLATTVFMTRAKIASDRALAATRENVRQTDAALQRFVSDAYLIDQLAAIPGAEGVRQQLLTYSLDLLDNFERQSSNDPALANDRALALSKKGSLTEKMGDRRLALDRHIAARNIWQSLLDSQPDSTEVARNLALAHNNVGMLLAELGREAEAVESLETALQIAEKLVAGDPASPAFAACLATSNSNLGLILKQLDRRDDAAARFREAIAIQERIVADDPSREEALRGLAASYTNLGSLDDSTDGALAMDVYRKAVGIQRRLVEAHPVNRLYQGDLARTYNNLGFALARRGNWPQAEACYANAIRLQELLVKASPLAASYRRDLAISHNNLGMVQSRDNRLADAEASFRRSLELQTLLADAEPTDAATLSNLGGVYNNLGLLCDRQHRAADAEENFRQAVHFQRQALEAAPQVARYRTLVDNHYANYVQCLRGQKKSQEAAVATRERDGLLAGATSNASTTKAN
jgi:serine/threonine protein kinase/tetratricopeptide (TPR) repeat protein